MALTLGLAFKALSARGFPLVTALKVFITRGFAFKAAFCLALFKVTLKATCVAALAEATFAEGLLACWLTRWCVGFVLCMGWLARA